MGRRKLDDLKAMVMYKKDGERWNAITEGDGNNVGPKIFDSRLDIPEALEKLGIEAGFEFKIWLQHEHKIAKPITTFKLINADGTEEEEEPEIETPVEEPEEIINGPQEKAVAEEPQEELNPEDWRVTPEEQASLDNAANENTELDTDKVD
jgi:hypothetical protein